MELKKKVLRLMSSPVRELVEERVSEFAAFVDKDEDEWFSELCFCLMTANFTALGGMRIQEAVGQGFLTLDEKALASRLRELGHRFPNARASYVVQAREFHGNLRDLLELDGKEARERLQSVRGLGMKEASHFLRNVGFTDVAIIDRHILGLLRKNGYADDKPLNRRRYLAYEEILKGIGTNLGLDMARLDLYMWFLETGNVLK